MMKMTRRSLLDLVSFIVDNRGRSCPTSDSGFPLIATNCLKDGRREPVFDNVRYVNEEVYSNWFRAHPMPDDVLFVCKGSPGRVAVVPDPVPFCIAQDMVALRARREITNPLYLYYRLRSPDVQSAITGMHVGTMIPHFKKGDFGKLKFPIIDAVSEQAAVAAILGVLDDKIAANGQIVDVADRLAAALTAAASSAGTVPLASVAEVTMGSSPPGTSYNENEDGLPLFQGVRDFGARFPENRVWTTGPTRLAQPGDTLVSVRAPVGRTNLANEEMCIGRGLAGVRSRGDRPYTLFHQLRSADKAWAPYEAEGTIFGSINRKQLESIQVDAVPDDRAAELEYRLASLEYRVGAALVENRRLTRTRDDLLPLLVAGRVRVRDAERVVEELV